MADFYWTREPKDYIIDADRIEITECMWKAHGE